MPVLSNIAERSRESMTQISIPPDVFSVHTTVTEAELAQLIELQRRGAHTSFPNVVRTALAKYATWHGIKPEADIWPQR